MRMCGAGRGRKGSRPVGWGWTGRLQGRPRARSQAGQGGWRGRDQTAASVTAAGQGHGRARAQRLMMPRALRRPRFSPSTSSLLFHAHHTCPQLHPRPTPPPPVRSPAGPSAPGGPCAPVDGVLCVRRGEDRESRRHAGWDATHMLRAELLRTRSPLGSAAATTAAAFC